MFPNSKEAKVAQVLFSIVIFLSFAVSADYNGSANLAFSAQEVSDHKQSIQEFNEVARFCLESYQNEHLSFYYDNCKIIKGQQVCLSKFFGERRYSKRQNDFRPDGTPLQYLGDALAEIGFPASYMNKMENTSCVGMALDCLKHAFLATNQENSWNKVLKFTKDNGVGGTALQEALRRLGWKVYYWNPSNNTDSMKKWDIEEEPWKSKGHHE